jgi:LacI family transcriptional regulator
MNVTLKDIAEKSGFSVNTVSRVMRGDPKISEKTRNIILEIAKEQEYIPDAIASSMRSAHSKTVGVITADSGNPFFSEVSKGIVEMADKLGYHILLGSTEESLRKEKELLKMFVSRHVDGLIVMPVFDAGEEHLQWYHNLSVPFVFPGRYLPTLEDHAILHGDVQGQKQVFDYLFDNGHRNILYLSGPKKVSNSRDRLQGMEESYAEHGIPLDEEYIMETAGHAEDGYALVNQALNKGLRFTAVASFNDLSAMGALKSLSENGLKVPEQVEVVGYDNLYMSQFMQPALTTVDVPKYRLGCAAMESLVSHINDPSLPYQKQELPTRLVSRETTRQKIYM